MGVVGGVVRVVGEVRVVGVVGALRQVFDAKLVLRNYSYLVDGKRI